MLVGILYGDGNHTAPRRRRRNYNYGGRMQYGGRGVVPTGYMLGSDELLGKGNFLMNMGRAVVRAPSKIVRATYSAAATPVRQITHGAANMARGVGGSVMGSVRSVGRSAAEAAPAVAAGLATVYGGATGNTGFVPPYMQSGLPPVAEDIVAQNKSNTALTYGVAGGGALLIGLAIFALTRRK